MTRRPSCLPQGGSCSARFRRRATATTMTWLCFHREAGAARLQLPGALRASLLEPAASSPMLRPQRLLRPRARSAPPSARNVLPLSAPLSASYSTTLTTMRSSPQHRLRQQLVEAAARRGRAVAKCPVRAPWPHPQRAHARLRGRRGRSAASCSSTTTMTMTTSCLWACRRRDDSDELAVP